jgi:hypothetical protein
MRYQPPPDVLLKLGSRFYRKAAKGREGREFKRSLLFVALLGLCERPLVGPASGGIMVRGSATNRHWLVSTDCTFR